MNTKALEGFGTAEFRCMISRFSEVVADWLITDVELDDLLAVSAGTGRALLVARTVPGLDAETRMRRSIELDQLLKSLLGSSEDIRAWLRCRNAALVGHARPIAIINDRADGLRALRDALREEALQSRVGSL